MSMILRSLGIGGERRQWAWPHTLWSMAQASASASGRPVTPATAIASTAVWGCVRVISESIATLPLNVYERTAEGRRRATDHALYPILHDRPNPRQTAVEFREQSLYSLLLWGNAYAWIERWPSGRPHYLWFLRPDRVTVKSDNTDPNQVMPRLVYVYRPVAGGELVYPADEILHVRGLSGDGLVGLSPISVHRDAIGNEQAERDFTGRFFANNARPGGVLKVPGRLNGDAAQRLKGTWEAAHRGSENAHRVAVLEEGIEWQALSMPLADAQLIEQRRFSLEEIARIFRVPPHLVGDLSRATFSNVEHQSLDFVIHTLRPWCVRLEQAYASLFFPSETAYYVEHIIDALVRGDLQSRFGAYAVARQNGFLSVNDIRTLENLNSIGAAGDVYLSPLNMIDAQSLVNAPMSTPTPDGSPTTARSLPNDASAVIDEAEWRTLPDDVERRFSAPNWLSANAARGLAWYREGKAGDGIVERTVREARLMAAGTVSEDKAVRMAAWFARHMVDLDAPAANPDHPDYPSPGVVAHALWGGGTRTQSERAMRWAEARVASMQPRATREALPEGIEGDARLLVDAIIGGYDVASIMRDVTIACGDDDAGQNSTD